MSDKHPVLCKRGRLSATVFWETSSDDEPPPKAVAATAEAQPKGASYHQRVAQPWRKRAGSEDGSSSGQVMPQQKHARYESRPPVVAKPSTVPKASAMPAPAKALAPPPPRLAPLPPLPPRAQAAKAQVVLRDKKEADSDEPPDWTEFKVWMYKDDKRFQWPEGIIDIRVKLRGKELCSEGPQLRAALGFVRWVLRQHQCEFKVGMCHHLGGRWLLYKESVNKWQPTHLFILLQAPNRSAVRFAEAGLIAMCEGLDVRPRHNMNLRNRDLGGTGPRSEFEYEPHWLYLAVKSTSV